MGREGRVGWRRGLGPQGQDLSPLRQSVEAREPANRGAGEGCNLGSAGDAAGQGSEGSRCWGQALLAATLLHRIPSPALPQPLAFLSAQATAHRKPRPVLCSGRSFSKAVVSTQGMIPAVGSEGPGRLDLRNLGG